MKTIWKFQLALVSPLKLEIPEGGEILTVQVQAGIPCLWAVVDPERATVPRYFNIEGTGNPIAASTEQKYVGTFQQPPFVWHVFERL